MRHPAQNLFALLLALLTASCGASFACADDPADTSGLQASLDELDAWVGPGTKGDKWRTYLRSEELRGQMALGADADLATVAAVLRRYQSGIAGLEKRRFTEVRRELQQWLDALVAHSDQDLSSLTWMLRGEHQPMIDERFAPVREELRKRAQALQRAIDRSNTSQRWKDYLRWDLLEPHFHDDVTINRQSLEDLDAVLRRFRSNQPGLETPVFARTAEAIERYRELAFWNALAQRRDTGPIYETYVKRLQEQLRRHLEDPTIETTRKVGSALGMVDHLGQSPWLVEAVRSRYSQPNIVAEVSVEAINEIAEPIHDSRPVRDCVLGAAVRGTAFTDGEVNVVSFDSPDEIQLEIQLAGHITTQTVGYKKPVQVRTTGHTNYSAYKRLMISDKRFHATTAHVSAKTKNHTRSVRKTGGDFGRKLIEKIAWKKVCQKKGQSERIAASKARRRVSQNFDERVVTALTRGRVRYDEKLRLPLIRRGLASAETHFTSTPDRLLAQLSLATGKQITTDVSPPAKDVQNHVSVQVHESAINNFMPFVLSGVSLKQDTADEPTRLEGDVPPWLKKLAGANNGKQSPSPLKVSPEEPPAADEQFKPFELVFNSEHPASVRFDENRLTVRLRFAVLKTGLDEAEKPLDNWDFLVSYEVAQRDNTVVLTRVGDIEVFPTGFDPRWDTQMTNEQVSYRNNLAKNINRKAARGGGFPAEIEIPELKLSEDSKVKRTFRLQQLECDDGWLTIGYRVL